MRLRQLEPDRIDDGVDVFVDLFQIHAHDPPSVQFELAITALVVRLEVRVAVEFDDELRRAASEVGDERPDWMLAAELDAELPRAKFFP